MLYRELTDLGIPLGPLDTPRAIWSSASGRGKVHLEDRCKPGLPKTLRRLSTLKYGDLCTSCKDKRTLDELHYADAASRFANWVDHADRIVFGSHDKKLTGEHGPTHARQVWFIISWRIHSAERGRLANSFGEPIDHRLVQWVREIAVPRLRRAQAHLEQHFTAMPNREVVHRAWVCEQVLGTGSAVPDIVWDHTAYPALTPSHWRTSEIRQAGGGQGAIPRIIRDTIVTSLLNGTGDDDCARAAAAAGRTALSEEETFGSREQVPFEALVPETVAQYAGRPFSELLCATWRAAAEREIDTLAAAMTRIAYDLLEELVAPGQPHLVMEVRTTTSTRQRSGPSLAVTEYTVATIANDPTCLIVSIPTRLADQAWFRSDNLEMKARFGEALDSDTVETYHLAYLLHEQETSRTAEDALALARSTQA